MNTRFLLDGAFARFAIRKDVDPPSVGQRSAAALFGPAGMPPHPAPACGIGSTLDADAGHAMPVHQDINAGTLGKSALKKCIDACEWLVFLVFFAALMGCMLGYGFPFMVG
jgi:hypothetical protein